MSSGDLPEINTLIELDLFGDAPYRSRIEDRHGDRLTVAAPLDLRISDLPQIGRPLTIRWGAGLRGRHVLPARIAAIRHEHVATWDVTATGEPEIEQNRRFVRGGGGEPVRLKPTRTPDEPAVDARVVDLGEGSVRARVTSVAVNTGDPVDIRMVLDEDIVELTGTVLRVVPAQSDTDVIVVFEPAEPQATIIRRYVLRQQLLTRTRVGG